MHSTGSTRADLTISFGGGGGGTPFGGGGGLPFGPPPGGGLPNLPGGGSGGGGLGGLCDLLPSGFARDACKAGTSLFGPGGNGGSNGGANCPDGQIRLGSRCVSPGDAFPGGDPFITPAGNQATQGSFGMPALTPTIEQRTVHSCPAGMVLGKDNLCYPKAILSRRSKFRKWKGEARPPVTAADAKAIRRAERVKNRVKTLGKDVGLKVTNR